MVRPCELSGFNQDSPSLRIIASFPIFQSSSWSCTQTGSLISRAVCLSFGLLFVRLVDWINQGCRHHPGVERCFQGEAHQIHRGLHGSMNDDKNLWWYFQQVLHCCDWQMAGSGTSHIWGPPASNTRSGCQRVEQKVSVATLQSHCLVVMSGACGPGAISTYLWIQDQKETSLCPRVSQTKTDMPRQSYCNRNAAKAPSQPGQQKVISRQRHVWGIPIAQVSQMPFWLQSSTKHERKKSDLAGFLWAKRATQRGAA